MDLDNLRWEAFVFDWDGTIMDTTALIAEGMQHAAVSMGYEDPGYEKALSTVGLSRAEYMPILCPDCPPERWDEFRNLYFARYLKKEAELPMRDGFEKLLFAMHGAGLRLAIATGKSRGGLNRVLNRFDCAEIFEATRTGDDTFSKPNPAMLFEISDEMGVSLDRMVMIGDSEHDLLMAQNAGCDAIGILGGASPKEVLEKIPHIALVGNVRELTETLGLSALLEKEKEAEKSEETPEFEPVEAGDDIRLI